MIWLGYFYRDVGSSKGPPQARRHPARGIALPCVGRRAGRVRCAPRPGPDVHHRSAAPGARRFCVAAGIPLRRTSDNTTGEQTSDSAHDGRLRDKDTPAPSRIGNIPTYGLPAASGASTSGYDSLNRTRKKPKFYPGQARPKPPPGPGSRAPVTSTGRCGCRSRHPRPPTRRRSRPRWPARWPASRRASG